MRTECNMVKSLLAKYSIAFTSAVNEHDLNNILVHLSELPYSEKHVAYRVFDTAADTWNLEFVDWVKEYTKNIDKEFNKGRKVTRLFDRVYNEFSDVFPYTLKAKEVYDLFISILLVDSSLMLSWSVPQGNDVHEVPLNLYAIKATRDYMCNMFKIVLLSIQNIYFEDLVCEFIVECNDFETLGNIIKEKVLHEDTEGY